MDHEFLDLIKTFEKTVGRLETLDSTILNFKDVIEGLRQNLDELVEMVQLEEIVELSAKGSQKITHLNQNLDDLSQTYQQLLQVDQLKENHNHRLMAIETTLNKIAESFNENHRTKFCVKSSYKALEDDKNTYYIETQTNRLMSIGEYNGPIGEIIGKKLVRQQNMIFVLDAVSGDIVVLNGIDPIKRYPLSATDFTVIGFEMYYLSESNLIRYHLLSDEKEVLLNEIVSMEELNHQLICQNREQQPVFIKLS